MLEQVQHTLSPWIAPDSRVLVLGTMPSPKSRARGMYYGHPQNRFWPTLAALWQEPRPQSPEEARAFALRHHLALWDVLASCTIDGAADSSITEPVPNDVPALLASTPSIHYIVTTGKKAAELYHRHLEPLTGLRAITLPSTSAANRGWWPDDKLLSAYRTLYELIEGGSSDGHSQSF
ncbi:MAG: DNA-deoxyinosine glycosylase [Peptococcaceae bacterium]|nr:DNA-deoxyinosine glycosylase [Peptococcaceae bacterium]